LAATIVVVGGVAYFAVRRSRAAVAVVEPTSADRVGVQLAFQSWEELPASCRAAIVPASDRYAKVSSSGITWAIARFEPAPGCTAGEDPAYPGGPPQPLTPDQIGPFGGGFRPLGVFEKVNGTWTMNEEGGSPFPCPAPGGQPPEQGNGSLPPNVLAAWRLSYASNCANVTYPPTPRGVGG
jgi:hypothetical protein